MDPVYGFPEFFSNAMNMNCHLILYGGGGGGLASLSALCQSQLCLVTGCTNTINGEISDCQPSLLQTGQLNV